MNEWMRNKYIQQISSLTSCKGGAPITAWWPRCGIRAAQKQIWIDVVQRQGLRCSSIPVKTRRALPVYPHVLVFALHATAVRQHLPICNFCLTRQIQKESVGFLPSFWSRCINIGWKQNMSTIELVQNEDVASPNFTDRAKKNYFFLDRY